MNHADEVIKKELPDMSMSERSAMVSILTAARLWDRERIEAAILAANWVISGYSDSGYRTLDEINAMLRQIEILEGR